MSHTSTDLGGGSSGGSVWTTKENSPEGSPETSPKNSPRRKSPQRLRQRSFSVPPILNSAILGLPDFTPGRVGNFGALVSLKKDGAGTGGLEPPTLPGIPHLPLVLHPTLDRGADTPRDEAGVPILPELCTKNDPKTPAFGEGVGDRSDGRGSKPVADGDSPQPGFTDTRGKNGTQRVGSANFSDQPEEKNLGGSANLAESAFFDVQNVSPPRGGGMVVDGSEGEGLGDRQASASAGRPGVVNPFGKLLSEGSVLQPLG